VATLTPPAAPAEGTVDVRYYAGLLWRGRKIVLTAALVGLSLGLFVALLQTPEYHASAMLQIEPPTPVFMGVTDALVGGGSYWQNADFYNTQFRVLKSRGLGEKVLEKLELKNRAPFKDSADPGALFMENVIVDPVPESRLVMVGVTLADPTEAARWANTLADVYIEQSVSSRVESARKAYEWVQGRLTATQQTMRDAQDRLFKSYQTQDLFVPEGSQSAVTTSITRLNEDQIAAAARRIVLDAALQQIAQMQSRGQSLDTVPQVAADDLYQSISGQVAALNLELTRLLEKYKAGHPDVQKVDAQIAQLKKARDERASQLVRGMRSELAQLERREAETHSAIDAQKAQAATQSRKGAELDALRKEAESAKNLYEVLLQKLNESDIAASIRNNNVTVVERATVPASPVRPDKKRIAGMAALLGLVLGAALLIGRDFLNNTLKDPEEMERYLHLDLLATVPRYGEATVHLVTEAYQNLRTALLFARKDEGGQVVLMTSTAPQEGKTTTLVNIAKLLASSGEKTIVIDCDLRRAQLHTWLGLDREPGLTDHFVSHIDLDTLIRTTMVPNLFALTAGVLPPNPPALLARRDLDTLLARLRRHFEWVLIDSPPLASVTDAQLLARHADIVLFVVQHNRVDKKLVKRMVSGLRKVTPNLLGGIFNAVDVKSTSSYSYSYYHTLQDQPARKDRSDDTARTEPAGEVVGAAKGDPKG
jgi:succinoglycan biosynthesis transport protein ExoP